MNSQELLQAGKVEEALACLQDEIRKNAADEKLRIFLFQILSVLGRWDRALTQLNFIESLGSDAKLMAKIFQPVIHCESLRAEIFAGKRTPTLFGEPADWMSMAVQAAQLAGQGKYEAAQALRDEAFDLAPATSGKLNDQPFQWIADADPRMGPILEAVIEGQYYWVPFCRIKKMVFEAPTDLRDLVWAPVQFVWDNGGEASGHVPVRYPGTESSEDDQLRLARKTDWVEQAGGYTLGVGQRLIATDADDFPVLECRIIDLDVEAPATSEPSAETEGVEET